ncbi:MAG: hypothetical protein KFF72_05380 [Arthrospira sp. SH-MAG29]|nr:hypothetical protein [Arthrospira sp. SH-MAG29]MBS0015785.1 hypothetical protein [Arthrospira sp. SH-MAG29]
MFHQKLYRSATSIFLTLGLTTGLAAPLLLHQTVARAQQLPGSLQRERISAGTTIPVEYPEAEKIVLTPTETTALTMVVARDIRTNQGRVWIPAGAEIVGELRPASGGSQFVANEVIVSNNRRYRLDANSNVVTRTETVRRGPSAGNILKGAAVGAAAAAALAGVLGDKAIATEEVLGGAGLGALAGVFIGRGHVDVVVIHPEQDLTLTMRSDVLFR